MFSSNTSQVSNDAIFVEDVFSTWLYTGNGATQTITNGIDLAGKGGLVWMKSRSQATRHCLFDTARGAYQLLSSDQTFGSVNSSPYDLSAFNNNGFTLQQSGYGTNASGQTYASWTFRKQPKFFDVVTYTGTGANSTIAHNLGSVPGCIIVKRTDSASNWQVYHRGLSSAAYLIQLNTTIAEVSSPTIWNSTAPTSTVFSLGTSATVNASGGTYVAYLFAHDAGGFGESGTDNVISCGSYTGNGSTQDINLGYEAQWVLVKNATTAGWDWYTIDNMRGFVVNPASPSFTKSLSPNTSGAESDQTAISPSSTGFRLNSGAGAFNQSGQTYIYIAIRRGPMKTPTTGTSVFAPVYVSAVAGTAQTTNFPVDAQILRYPQDTYSNFFVDRLRGVSTTPANQASPYLLTNTADAETTGPNLTYGWGNTGFAISSSFNNLLSIFWNFRRAPGFFDVVCYRGAGSTQDLKHNLQVPPELLIFKDRSNSSNWDTYYPVPGQSYFYDMKLNTLATPTNRDYSGAFSRMRAAPDATTVYLNTNSFPNNTGANLVCYLFATCPGVSKVGIVEVTGSLQTVNCGFTSGARFVMIKSITNSSNSAYGWRVYDTARGITSGNDPVLYLNSTDGQTNTQNSINAVASGFQITGNDPYLSSGSFIYLAIA